MRDIKFLTKNEIDVEGSIELLGDLEIYEETLQDFLDVSEERMPLIEKYKNENDMKNYEIQVHSLKSDSKYLGFTKLAELAFIHQEKSKIMDSIYINTHYQELIEETKRIIEIIKLYLQ